MLFDQSDPPVLTYKSTSADRSAAASHPTGDRDTTGDIDLLTVTVTHSDPDTVAVTLPVAVAESVAGHFDVVQLTVGLSLV